MTEHTSHTTPIKNSSLSKVTFKGAALEVTGSCHLLKAMGKLILFDCGMRQGGGAARKVNNEDFDFDPASIDMVVLSHAHLDHSGALPKLVSGGFKGRIYATNGSQKLLPIMLHDSYRLYERDNELRNIKRKRQGRKTKELKYTLSDVEDTLSQLYAIPYQQSKSISPGIELKFLDAGHILGSAIVELVVSDGERSKTMVFSGDLGNSDTSLMYDPTAVEHADLVLLESTYGDRNHRNQGETLAEFKAVINQAAKESGNIMIPAFAVGRTQELLFQLGYMYQQGELDGWQVFLDSPMATSVTKIYDQCIATLDRKDTGLMKAYGSMTLEQFLPCLTISETVDDSIAINDVKSKAIIIAGSGMCTGGRIRHHFKQRIWQKNSHIIFVGFQAQGTFGRRLLERPKTVKFFGKKLAVNAQIHTIGGFSAHAGQDKLVEWAKQFKGKPKFCLVHGEQSAIIELRDQLLMRADIVAEIAVEGASVYF
jgi:metallo-beta-lactamase family protein